MASRLAPLATAIALAACTEPLPSDPGASEAPSDLGGEDQGSPEDLGTTEDLGGGVAPDSGVAPEPPFPVSLVDGEVSYRTNYPAGENVGRTIRVRLRYPNLPAGRPRGGLPVVLVSHGGSGSVRGHTTFEHVGVELAGQGYLAVHLNHPVSPSTINHRWDRPYDVSAVLDALFSSELTLPPGVREGLDPERVGHIGHSWGAYTAHALGGATLDNPLPDGGARWGFRDERIRAIVALSPQGFGQFGQFDAVETLSQGSPDNSWRTVGVPSFALIGALEMDGVAGVENPAVCPECFRVEGWRRFPFARYPADGRRHLSVLAGQTHASMGNTGSAAVQRHIAVQARLFFDIYLRGMTGRIAELEAPDPLVDRVYVRK